MALFEIGGSQSFFNENENKNRQKDSLTNDIKEKYYSVAIGRENCRKIKPSTISENEMAKMLTVFVVV